VSLILDALNRSRQNTDQVPGLATQHYAENSTGGSHVRQYVPWLALLIALLVIAWLALDRIPQPQPVTEVTTIALAPAAPPEAPAQVAAIVRTPVPDAITAQESPPVQAQPATKLTAVEDATIAQTQVSGDDSAVADLYRQRPEPAPVTAPATVKPAIQPAPEPTARSRAAPTVAERPAVSDVVEASREEQPIDIEQMVLKARSNLENARLEEHSAPFIADLSQQTKDSIPTIFYERHDYSDDKSQSSVVCNGKVLKVGGSPAAGVKVEEILPDSVVLSYRSTQFRLRALNSWVNL
jgi:general secretion pathway protein B